MIPHGLSAQKFINHINFRFNDESTRCRILLAEVLLRLERLEKNMSIGPCPNCGDIIDTDNQDAHDEECENNK